MPSFIEFVTTYNLEVEWLLMWFPIRANRPLEETQIRGDTIRHVNTDFGPGFGVGTGVGHFLGQGGRDGDALTVNNIVYAEITIEVPLDKIFRATLRVQIGRSTREKKLVLPPGTTTPFMINLRSRADDELTVNTAITLHGVFRASDRVALTDIASWLQR